MITDEKVSSVETSGVVQTSKYKIKADGKGFNLIFTGLYSDPLRAIARELLANGTDSQVAAGKPDIPVKLTLPSRLDETFSVRDFGTSMSHDFVMNRFNTAFESTKDKSNDEIGGFGLGGKTPFIYLDTFSIRCFSDGKCRVYSAFIAEDGNPEISLMFEEDSQEPRGVEVSFPVKPQDNSMFAQKAAIVAATMKVRPECSNDLFKSLLEEYDKSVFIKGEGFVVKEGRTTNILSAERFYVNMGGVSYPIDLGELSSVGDLYDFLCMIAGSNVNVIFDIPIGSVAITPSRETLRYTEQTKKVLRKRLSEVMVGVYEEVNKLVRTNTNLFDRAVSDSHEKSYLMHLFRNMPEQYKGGIKTKHFGMSFVQNPQYCILNAVRKVCKRDKISNFFWVKDLDDSTHSHYSSVWALNGTPSQVYTIFENADGEESTESGLEIHPAPNPFNHNIFETHISAQQTIPIILYSEKCTDRKKMAIAMSAWFRNNYPKRNMNSVLGLAKVTKEQIKILWKALGCPKEDRIRFVNIENMAEFTNAGKKLADMPVLRWRQNVDGYREKHWVRVNTLFIKGTNREVILFVGEDKIKVGENIFNRTQAEELCRKIIAYEGQSGKNLSVFCFVPESRVERFRGLVTKNVKTIDEKLKEIDSSKTPAEWKHILLFENSKSVYFSRRMNCGSADYEKFYDLLTPKARAFADSVIEDSRTEISQEAVSMGLMLMNHFKTKWGSSVKNALAKRESGNIKAKGTKVSQRVDKFLATVKKHDILTFKVLFESLGYFRFYQEGDTVGEYSHAPHLARVMNKYIR